MKICGHFLMHVAQNGMTDFEYNSKNGGKLYIEPHSGWRMAFSVKLYRNDIINVKTLEIRRAKEMPILDSQKSDMNQMGNSQNPWQGDRKKVLCCCSAGLLRSPTAAHLLNQKYGYNTAFCGMEPEYAKVPCTQCLVYWADEIVVMDRTQALQVEEIIKSLPEEARKKGMATPIKVLGINDSYAYMDDELQRLIIEKYHVN